MSNRPIMQRLLTALAAVGILFLGSTVPGQAAGNSGKSGQGTAGFWTLYPRHLEPRIGTRSRLACGDYGVFHLGRPLFRPGRFQSLSATGPIDSPSYPRRSSAIRQETGTAFEDVPCQYGSCFSLLDEIGPDQPWAAVIDWDDWHGWSVGAALQQASDAEIPVVLFPLDVSRFAGLGEGVTDLQVLEQACSIAEEVDRGGRMPPVIINMSFGRLAQPDESAGQCRSGSLGCQLGRVLSHLYMQPGRDGLGTVLVAAAGNHRRALYPAAAEHVVAAGQLDLAAFESYGLQKPSWETPQSADQPTALFPGYGLCLGFESDPADDQGWPAPAGSSYAAAVFSGWLSGALLRGEVDDPLGENWTIGHRCRQEACGYQLIQGERELSFNARADRMVRHVFGSAHPNSKGGKGRPCPTVSKSASTIRLQDSGLKGQWTQGALPSLAEILPRRGRPTPSPWMCIPCIAVSRPKPPKPPNYTTTAPLLASSGEYGTDLLVNVEDGVPLQAGIRLESVSLQVGEDNYQLDISEADLELISQGAADSLLLAGVAKLIPGGVQASVYYLFSNIETGEVFWSSTPILMSEE